MNWTPTDSGQLLLLAMIIFSGYALVRGIAISQRRKKESDR